MKVTKIQPKPPEPTFEISVTREELNYITHFMLRGLKWADIEYYKCKVPYASDETVASAYIILNYLEAAK